jgi:hypothetical protein
MMILTPTDIVVAVAIGLVVSFGLRNFSAGELLISLAIGLSAALVVFAATVTVMAHMEMSIGCP